MKRTVVFVVLAMLCWMPIRGDNTNATFANDTVLKDSGAVEIEKIQAQVAELEEKLRVANEEANVLKLKVSELGMEVVRLKTLCRQAKIDPNKKPLSALRIAKMEEAKLQSKKPKIERKNKPTKKYGNFRIAIEGEYWRIDDDNVAVTRTPDVYANTAAFMRDLITVLSPGTEVEILESKGWLDVWKRVYVINNIGVPIAEGWILADSIERAVRTKRGMLSID